jgi:ribosomal protein S30
MDHRINISEIATSTKRMDVARHFEDRPQMTDSLNFDIKPVGTISRQFLAHNISTFNDATKFVRQLAYGRNENKADLTTVFTDNCGTCSTKHALLKQLADENNFVDFKLFTGLFRMNSSNTPKISATLKRHKLDYIPEAHNYLKYGNQILDFTNKTSKPADFENELIEETEIRTDQIADFKINYHKQYLTNWLNKQKTLNLTLDELWKIREQCITDLSTS